MINGAPQINHEHETHHDNGMRSKANWVLIGFLVVAGYFLITEHRAHLSEALNYLPYLLLLACPLMHVFMHRGHGGHGGDRKPDDVRGDDAARGERK